MADKNNKMFILPSKRKSSSNTSGPMHPNKKTKVTKVLTVLPPCQVRGINGAPPTIQAAQAVTSVARADDPLVVGKLPLVRGETLDDIEESAFERFPERYKKQAARPQQATYAGKYPESAAKLASKGFGRPTTDLNLSVGKAFHHAVPSLFTTGFLADEEVASLEKTQGAYGVVHSALRKYKHHDFSKIAEFNPDWATQSSIPEERIENFLAALLHYKMDMGAVIRYAGNNYTAEYRDPDAILAHIKQAVSPDIYDQCRRILKQGSPTLLQGDMTNENFEAYRKHGNAVTIAQNIQKVWKTINKEERNCNLIPLPSWVGRFLPDAHLTPQAYLIKEGKNDRLIFDGKKQPYPWCVAINMITHKKNEPQLIFGTAWQRHLRLIYNLRISHPHHEIYPWDDDAKGAFRHVKHNPDIATAYAFIIEHFAFGSTSTGIWGKYKPTKLGASGHCKGTPG